MRVYIKVNNITHTLQLKDSDQLEDQINEAVKQLVRYFYNYPNTLIEAADRVRKESGHD